MTADSKLAEKLGFEVFAGGTLKVNHADGTFSVLPAEREMQALWSLCLELSERLAVLEESARLNVKDFEALAERLAEKEKKA